MARGAVDFTVTLLAGSTAAAILRVGDAAQTRDIRLLPEETAIAFDYDGVTHAVMMATPADLDDFAIGFSLSEGVIGHADEMREMRVVPMEGGIVLRMSLAPDRDAALVKRRRHLAGPTGCGLCGLDSLAEAGRALPVITTEITATVAQIHEAMAALPALQTLNAATRAVHAAAFWVPNAGIVAVREDVGRHNALDKLAGALARASIEGGGGIVLLTSRISVEMVQKTAILGCGILVAISAPTALAVRTAERCGVTLIGVTRSDGFEIFTHAQRIILHPTDSRTPDQH